MNKTKMILGIRARVVHDKGSWQAGVDGAHAGILLPAHPKPGIASWYEDESILLSLDKKARVPSGLFDRVLVTTESTPEKVEHKFYAPEVGPVPAVLVSGGSGREELRVDFPPGRWTPGLCGHGGW